MKTVFGKEILFKKKKKKEVWSSIMMMCSPQLLHPDERKRLQSVKKAKELKCFQDLNWDDIEQGKATPSFIPPVRLRELLAVWH